MVSVKAPWEPESPDEWETHHYHPPDWGSRSPRSAEAKPPPPQPGLGPVLLCPPPPRTAGCH